VEESKGNAERGLEAPQSRLERLGAGALTDAELLGIVLHEGRLSAMENLLAASGGFRALAVLPWDQLCAAPSLLGAGGASRLLCAIELGRRTLQMVERRPRLRSPVEVHRYLRPVLGALRREVFHVLSFNVRQVLVSDVRVAEGAIDSCALDPREVYASAVAARASGVILAHNHPSGSPEPSDDDRRLNEQLEKGLRLLGIRLIDHLVVGDCGFTSLMRSGAQMKIPTPFLEESKGAARRRRRSG
jgi:DNA repair protein RadC